MVLFISQMKFLRQIQRRNWIAIYNKKKLKSQKRPHYIDNSVLSKTVKPTASAKRVEFDWITLDGLRNFNMKKTCNKVRIFGLQPQPDLHHITTHPYKSVDRRITKMHALHFQKSISCTRKKHKQKSRRTHAKDDLRISFIHPSNVQLWNLKFFQTMINHIFEM